MIAPIRDERGFSLVEIMIVVGIIGAIAAMSAGSFTNFVSSSNFKTQKNTVLEALTRARNMANSRDECVRVTIDGQIIHVVGHELGASGSCDPVGAQSIVLPDFVIATGYTLGEFTSTPGGDKTTTIVFDTVGGVVAQSNPLEIYLADPKGMQQGFRIYPALGQIRTLTPGTAPGAP